MTKKDYELIAWIIILGTNNDKTRRFICNTAINILSSKNPRFNKDKFLQACGVEVESHICQHNNPKACCATCKYIESNK